MYCPKCGAKNIAEAKFCRMCGAAFPRPVNSARSLSIPPDYGRAFRPLVVGIGFLIVVLISVSSHTGFFWWMMFPAFSCISKGMRRLHQIKRAQVDNDFLDQAGMLNPPSSPSTPAVRYGEVRARPTGELTPPPSVTENTTRLLDR